MENNNKKMLKGRDILLCLNEINLGNWDKIYSDVKRKRNISTDEVEAITKDSGDFVCLIDEAYPENLKNGHKPPFVLYYKGNIELLKDKRKKVAVLNSNQSSKYADDAIAKLCNETENKCIYVVQYGTKKQNALVELLINLKRDVIVVLNKGFGSDESNVLNALLENNGLVLTSFPKSLSTKSNETDKDAVKIAVSLADSVLLGAITKKSNEMCGIAYALSKGNDILCIPFPIDSNYANNELIKDGACLVENGEDVIREIN